MTEAIQIETAGLYVEYRGNEEIRVATIGLYIEYKESEESESSVINNKLSIGLCI